MLTRVFLNHPHSIDESYSEHAAFAGRFALRLFAAAGAAAVHAVIPALFERTAGNMVVDMYEDMRNRGH